ncbi:MAG TPA: hypothetical protein VFM67_04480 [Gaiella sp.]|nr:hypothetical protein [Gaiella sp.]
MGALPRVVGHHLDPATLVVETVVLLVLLVGFGTVWFRERRRRVDRSRRIPELRD